MVCDDCNKCVPRAYWGSWGCNHCSLKVDLSPGDMSLSAVVRRSPVVRTMRPIVEQILTSSRAILATLLSEPDGRQRSSTKVRVFRLSYEGRGLIIY